MPTYLCHGFRWHRRDIRVFVVVNNIDDAAPNWLIASTTSSAILNQLHTNYDFLPEPLPPAPSQPNAVPAVKHPLSPLAYDPKENLMHRDDDHSLPPPRVPACEDPVLMHSSWSPVKLLEEFDPEDMSLPSRPYAYVADYAERIDLSVDVAGAMARYQMQQKQQGDPESEWFSRLRDGLQKGEDIRWYVVVCGDDVRELVGDSESELSDEGEEGEDEEVEVEQIDGEGGIKEEKKEIEADQVEVKESEVKEDEREVEERKEEQQKEEEPRGNVRKDEDQKDKDQKEATQKEDIQKEEIQKEEIQKDTQKEEDHKEKEQKPVEVLVERSPVQVAPNGLRPLPSGTTPDQRPKTSPAGAVRSESMNSLQFRPSPLGSHPANPKLKVPPEPADHKQPSKPPLRSKKSMVEGLRRLFGVKKEKK
ncbi:hypothetical protein BGZ63DRAFT_422533 [Mariannaea sp. PMI_226]|nr:hypothetical protein BGZ63DRAFT_422533 [Mariannaea sp. PMI_226]